MKKSLILISSILMSFVLLLSGCSEKKVSKKETNNAPLGIIGAMDSEVKILKGKLIDNKITKIAGIEFNEGKLEGKDVVIAQAGIGKVNAAICTQIMIDKFNVKALLNTGVAGGLYKDLKVGDIVVSTNTVEHDFDVTAFGHPKGYISGMGTEGQVTYFEADKNLLSQIEKSLEETLKENKYYLGTIASGDIFVSDANLKKDLVKNFNAYAAEMEGASIGHVATLNKVPFVVLRSISDLADGSAHVTYSDFEKKAAEVSSNVVINFVKSYNF